MIGKLQLDYIILFCIHTIADRYITYRTNNKRDKSLFRANVVCIQIFLSYDNSANKIDQIYTRAEHFYASIDSTKTKECL